MILSNWLFLPRPWLQVDEPSILKNEQIGSGETARVCQFVHRAPGARMYVKGCVRQQGRTAIALAYWHQVIRPM